MFHGMSYVYEVYKELSFSKAAKNLYISQPSLSAAVKKVETKIGFPIFDRSTTPIQLTVLGQEYIRTVEAFMDLQKGFENYIHDIQELKTGSLSIGGTNLFASYIVPRLISDFTEKHPGITFDLVEDNTTKLTETLFSGKLDVLIDNGHMDPAIYEKRFFCQEYLILAVPQKFESNQAAKKYALTADDIIQNSHLLPSVPAVPLVLFKEDPFLFLKSGNDTRTRADALCAASQFTSKIKLKLDQQITAYNLSCYGMGIAFIGDVLIKHVPQNNAVMYYKLDSPLAVRDVNFYYKKKRYLSKVLKEFLQIL